IGERRRHTRAVGEGCRIPDGLRPRDEAALVRQDIPQRRIAGPPRVNPRLKHHLIQYWRIEIQLALLNQCQQAERREGLRDRPEWGRRGYREGTVGRLIGQAVALEISDLVVT